MADTERTVLILDSAAGGGSSETVPGRQSFWEVLHNKQVLKAAAVVRFGFMQLVIVEADFEAKNFSDLSLVKYTHEMSLSLFCMYLQVAPLWFAAQYTFNVSLAETSVTSNTILASTSSLFTYGLSCLLLLEVFVVSKLAFILMCMAGETLSSNSPEECFVAVSP